MIQMKPVWKIAFIHCVKVSLFTVASYGLLFLIYGETRISFIGWAAVLFAAFTIEYIPTFF